jgi:hypothetical protein
MPSCPADVQFHVFSAKSSIQPAPASKDSRKKLYLGGLYLHVIAIFGMTELQSFIRQGSLA